MVSFSILNSLFNLQYAPGFKEIVFKINNRLISRFKKTNRTFRYYS